MLVLEQLDIIHYLSDQWYAGKGLVYFFQKLSPSKDIIYTKMQSSLREWASKI